MTSEFIAQFTIRCLWMRMILLFFSFSLLFEYYKYMRRTCILPRSIDPRSRLNEADKIFPTGFRVFSRNDWNRTPCITRRLLYTEWGTVFIYGEVVVGQLRGAAIIQSSRTI